MNTNLTERVGNYVVTPLIQTMQNGLIEAAVSIRRGKYDRIFRFIPQFASETLANSYTLAQARTMALSSFCRSNGSRELSFLMTTSGTVSTTS